MALATPSATRADHSPYLYDERIAPGSTTLGIFSQDGTTRAIRVRAVFAAACEIGRRPPNFNVQQGVNIDGLEAPSS
jgi:hypothetical protein